MVFLVRSTEMGNCWQRKANRMFGPMPPDPLQTAHRAVRKLREDSPCEAVALGYLADIHCCLSEFPSTGMSRLGITEEELDQWKKKYRE